MSMQINYGGKIYKVDEPTIEVWAKLILLQEWTDEREFAIRLLSFITGLTEEEIEKSDVIEVLQAAADLSKYLMSESKVFHNEFDFNGVKYKFLDLTNMTFGEFIDLDTYLTKTDVEKKKELNLFMAMLYRELDDKGNYKPYDSNEMMKRAEIFKKLPVKYVNGASTFFLRSEKILSNNIKTSLSKRLKIMINTIWNLKKLIVSTSIGVGSLLLSRLRTKILRK
jgi:hypothetical protein